MNPALIFGLGGFVYLSRSKLSITETQNYYEKELKGTWPVWIFPLFWNILEPLLVVSGYYTFETLNQYSVPFIVLFFINIILKDTWSIIFFDMKKPQWALLVAFLLIGTSLPILVLNGILQNWIAFWTYFPYCLWLIVAFFLNFSFRNHGESKVPPKMNAPTQAHIKRKIVWNA